MRKTNLEMDALLASLRPYLERSDVIGYAAARNARLLREALTEYHAKREELIRRHGTDDGNGTIAVDPDGDKWEQFAADLEVFASIEHDFEPFKIGYTEAMGLLTGAQILEIDWMMED